MTYRSFLAACLLFLTGCGLVACTASSDKPADTTADTPSDSIVVTVVSHDTTSVLDLLLTAHKVEYRSSSMGAFVTAIDSVSGGGSAFWLYSVNDTMVPLAADKMIVQPGDTVRWHLRKSGS
jgi:hypothetical protein